LLLTSWIVVEGGYQAAGQVRPSTSRSNRGGSPPAPRNASAWNGNHQY